MSKVPMTAAGAEKLQAELKSLKSKSRPKIIKAIAEARAHGDLRENAEYHAAREQQGFVEGRMYKYQSRFDTKECLRESRLGEVYEVNVSY